MYQIMYLPSFTNVLVVEQANFQGCKLIDFGGHFSLLFGFVKLVYF